MKKVLANKQLVLWGGTLLLLIVCYQFAFKQTFIAWQEHRLLQSQLTEAADVSTSPAYLERKSANLGRILSDYQLDSSVFRNNAIDLVAGFAEKRQVKLVMVPADEAFYHTPQFIVQKLNLEGRFFDLLNLMNDVQHAKGIGLLRSVTIKVHKPDQVNAKSSALIMELYLEIYRK